MISSTDFNQLRGVVEYLKWVPYDVTRKHLYTAAELYRGFVPNHLDTFATCHDSVIYRHFVQLGKMSTTVEESLARALHDHGMHIALDRFLSEHDQRRCLGIMGGHALCRTDAMYRQIVSLSKLLTEEGFVMLSGGGPGAMEAAHLGAWLAGRSEQDVEQAMKMLVSAPSFHDDGWLSTAFEVIDAFPQKEFVSLGIPTWHYGHEPSTPFATHIAKFFENSIREDSILTFAYGGIIYTPGSAGTLQEIFQDAVQNHYLSFGFSSPMVFLGKDFWTREVPVYPMLTDLQSRGKYKNLLLKVTDDNDEIVAELQRFRGSR